MEILEKLKKIEISFEYNYTNYELTEDTKEEFM